MQGYGLIFSRTILLAASVFLFAIPAAEATLYAPGATLDPTCAPTDPNCGVESNVATGTLGQVPYYAANGNVLAATSTFQILTNGTASTTNFIVGNSLTIGTLTGVLYGNNGTLNTVATTSVTCTGSATCTAFTVIGSSPITINATGGGGGSGTVGTSTNETAGFLSYWTSTSATPALLGKVATTTLAGSGGISVTAGAVVIGSSPISVSCANCLLSNAGDWAGTWQTFSPSHFQVAGSYLTFAIQTLGDAFHTGLTGATQTLATSTADTNLGMTIVSSGTQHLFTPYWIGTLADGRIESAVTWNAKQAALGFTPISNALTKGNFLVGNDAGVAQATSTIFISSIGNVGIGTTTPWRMLSLTGTVSSPQFALAYDATRYAQLQTDASGDLSILTTGGNTRLPDNNLFVCAGGACPTLSITGTGNLTVENKMTAGSIEEFCPAGYVWVPGEARYGTLPGFCTMKYDAKNSGGTPVSVPAGGPWVSIDQPTARAACQALGAGYHLISEPEWMTIADQIAALPINDIDAAAGLQLATGHSDNAPTSALDAGTSATDPVVSGCNLLLPLSDASNAYAASSCELRGTGAGGSTDADKGYYGTGNVWSASGYVSGASNKSQLRTTVLPNGTVLWDIAGNVWEWTDAYVNSAGEKPTPLLDAWQEFSAITNYVTLNYARPKNPSWTSANGIGQEYGATAAGQYAFIRGGDWDGGADGGVFTLGLNSAPSNTSTNLGFRCSR